MVTSVLEVLELLAFPLWALPPVVLPLELALPVEELWVLELVTVTLLLLVVVELV